MLRKYIIGFVAGLLFMASVPAYGAISSMVGKRVASEIKVTYHQEEIGNAIVVDGRSYLPIRDLSNALNLKLSLTKEEIGLMSNAPTGHDKSDQITYIDDRIRSLTGLRDVAARKRETISEGLSKPFKLLDDAKTSLERFTDTTVPQYYRQLEEIERLEKLVRDSEQELISLEAQIEEYDRQIQELEVQKDQIEEK